MARPMVHWGKGGSHLRLCLTLTLTYTLTSSSCIRSSSCPSQDGGAYITHILENCMHFEHL